MHISSLLIILVIYFKYKSCSLLSRLKNRYEYIPQENNVENFTEDLYDFELLSAETTAKSIYSSRAVNEKGSTEKHSYRILPSEPNAKQIKQGPFTKNLYERPVDSDEPFFASRQTLKTRLFNAVNKITEEDLYHIPRSGSNQKQNYATPSTKVLYEFTSVISDQLFFLPRMTLKTSSTTSTKTWPTYFPIYTRKTLPTFDFFLRKPLLRKLEIGEIKSTKGIERNYLNNRTTLSSVTAFNHTNVVTYNFNTSSSFITTASTFPSLFISVDITTALNTSVSTTKVASEDLVKNETISYCYRCGLNESGIPTDLCYNTFEGDDRRFGSRSHLFRMKCIRSEKVSEVKNVAYGPLYRKGCFKRFLDVGTEYNERGCRYEVPIRGKSFASIRLARMEYLLKDVEDGCVFSPHASITPFSRAVSLFVRYHVCVCSQKYCNRAYTIKQNPKNAFFIVTMLSFIIMIYILILHN